MPRITKALRGVAGAASLSLLGLGVVAGTAAMTATAAGAAPVTHASAAKHSVTHLCAMDPKPGFASCMALKQTGAHPQVAGTDATPSGYGPSDLASAYNLPSGGSGQTVGIVDAQDDPNAESDLATYRSTYGLPACTTANGCFSKLDQNGGTNYPTADAGWAGEISLDLDMVSAVCPNCHIVLVEADSASMDDLGAAENEAVAAGAGYVSNSYGGAEDSTTNSEDSQYFDHPGTVITASTGDSGYGASFPATGANVTAVGGTSLTQDGSARGWSETAWSDGGSGCSAYVAKPSFQSGIDTGCSNRAEADVSAVADPNTGVAVYDTYQASGWNVYGGTSASSPIIASVYALAGSPGSTPNADPYGDTGDLNDVTSGSNGSCSSSVQCNAGSGWDGPTGLGTPNGTGAFTG